MTTIYCRCRACLSNSKGKCTANSIQLDKNHICKDYVQHDSLMSRHAVFRRKKRRLTSRKTDIVK